MVSRPPKGTSLRETTSFDVFCVKIGARVSAVAFLKNPKNSRHFVPRGAKSRMRRTETPKSIWIKFCMVVDITDIVTNTNFGDHRLRGFWVAVRRISPSPKTITFFGIPDPYLPIHYTTFIGLRRLRVVYSRASPMLKALTA